MKAVIDNQLAAQLLFDHKLATREEILASWPFITAEKDVGAILVERGLLPAQTYHQMMVYLQTNSPAPQAHTPTPGTAASPAESPRKDSSAGGVTHDARSSQKGPRAKPHGQKNENVVELSLTDEPNPGSAPSDETWSPAPVEKTQPIATPSLTPTQSSQRNPAVTSAEFRGGASSGNIPAVAPEAIAREPIAMGATGPQSGWNELLAYARHSDASDLHLSAGNPILLRRYGHLQAAGSTPMDQESLRRWAESALDGKQWEEFDAKGDLEIIYTLEGHGRYRVTLMKQRRGFDITARVIPARIRSFDDLGLPESCRELSHWAQGLVLLTGPVGCGKSSTLSTLVDMVNRERHDHIITIEEPIEILYEPVNCRITQRQIGPHTLSRDAALRAALREDPDIIVISELRDLDTIRLAVSAAETGHLVFGTMNTTNAGRTIYRLIDSFPPEEQGIIRNMISESLRGVISQQLLSRKDGQGMIPAFEVLLVNSAVGNLIRKDEAHQLGTAMITGKAAGMVLLDDSLRNLVERGLIDPALAMSRANNPKDFERYVGKGGR